MSIYRTDNPIADFDSWDAEQERARREFLEDCYTCEKCGEPIEDDCYYEINGEKWCEHCIDESRRFY